MQKIISIPLFSVITTVLNGEDWIARNMRSVQEQTYSNVEHLIMDAASQDQTLTIAASNASPNTRIFSEADRGIYDGMNRGISVANGRYVAILNADDRFTTSKTLAKVAQRFAESNTDIVTGNVRIMDRRHPDRCIRTANSPTSKPRMLQIGRLPGHPAFFVRREIYEKHGLFNLNFPISADIDIIARFVLKENLPFTHIPDYLTDMTYGGCCNLNPMNILKAHTQLVQAWHNNGLPITPYFLYRRAICLAGALTTQIRPIQPLMHKMWEWWTNHHSC